MADARCGALGALVLPFALLAGCSGGGNGDAGGDGRFPPYEANLLVISMDTARADHLSAFGYDRPTTPRLERLAADAHVFEAAYTVMPTTLPSHASIFTSLYPAQLRVRKNGDRVPDDVAMLAEVLASAGFVTGAFVSAAPLHPKTNFDQGFDTYVHPESIAGRKTREVPASDVRAAAAAWLAARGDERFFCFVHLFDPHTWYEPPLEVREQFEVPPGRFPPARKFLTEPIASEAVRASVDAYDAEIRFADTEIGRLLDATPGEVLDRTIVVFLSDHGETLDEMLPAYGFDHGEFLYRRELRIPLLIRLPHGFPDRDHRTHGELVSTLDVTPTLLDLLGLPAAAPAEGRSLLPLLRGGSLQPRAVVSQRHTLKPGKQPLEGDAFSIVSGRWHWIRQHGREDLLFDLVTDPLERQDVLAQHEELVPELEAMLEQWRAHVGKPRSGESVDDAELHRALEALGYVDTGEQP
jgi:arylsulfatase A-like enzyme